MGKGTFFSLKFNLELFTADCVPHHGVFSFCFHFVFLQRLESQAASLYLATPGERHGPLPYLWEAHFPEGNFSASTLGSALK